MKYIDGDSMIFAFHESFLWIKDLSQPDPWILPIIAGIATFFGFAMNQAMADTSTAGQTAGMMKMMKYLPCDDPLDGEKFPVRSRALLGSEPDHPDLLQYPHGVSQKKIKKRI